MFACHFLRCGDEGGKRNMGSTVHITSLGLSAPLTRIPKGRERRERRNLSYAFTVDCALFVVTQTSDSIDFQGSGYGERLFFFFFPTSSFQVFF